MKKVRKAISVLLALMILVSCAGAAAEEGSWICAECGKENTTKFCTKCGAKKPEEIVCPGCGRKYPADTDAVFCGECGTKLQQEPEADLSFRYEGEGFDTPEDAALCYMAGLKNLDFEQMLSAFAWETQAENFNFKSYITRMKGIGPTVVPGMPSSNGLLFSSVVEMLRDYQIRMIYRSIVSYVNDEVYQSKTNSIMFQTEEELKQYFQRCDNRKIQKLAEMDNIRFYSPDDITGGLYSIARTVERRQLLYHRYGADAVKDIVIAADIGDDVVVAAPTAVCYGDRWYLANTGGMIQSIMNIGPNNNSFYVLPDDMKYQLKYLVPVASASDLPERAEKQISYEGSGFDTPEEAVSYYLEGLKNGNVQQMLQAFAWETQANRYSLTEYVNYYQAILGESPVILPASNSFMERANLGSLRYLQSRMINDAIRCYVLEDANRFTELMDGYYINMSKDKDVDAFIALFDNDKAEKLKSLGNAQLYEPENVIPHYDSDNIHEQLDRIRRIYGADEIREFIVLAEMEGETLVTDPLLVRYGGKWYMITVSGRAFFMLGIESNRQAFMTVKASAQDALNILRR